MKSIHILFFIFLATGFFSCEKVIEVKIRDADTKYVIEGEISDDPGVCKVKLTKTKKVNDNNQFPTVTGAVVKVSDNGTEYILTETGPGVYETNRLNGTPGHLYQLSVAVDNKLFTAACTMPQPVPIDTITIMRTPFGDYDIALVFYTDPAGVNNGYRFIEYVNRLKVPTIFWDNDEFTDGQSTVVYLDNDSGDPADPRSINRGDTVMVELLSLDDPIYRFWSSLQIGGADGSGYTASPANPITNIQGGALGYFSAHAIRRKSVIAR